MQIKNCQIKIVQGDITELKAEAIVNAANNKLVMGGGVAGAIRKKGGKLIEDEAVAKGPIRIGQAVYTQAGNLPAKFVIHAATMGMDFVTDQVKIRQSCASSLDVAEELKIKTIALPALGCGVGNFPYLASAKIMAQEVFKHIRETPDSSTYSSITNAVLKTINRIDGSYAIAVLSSKEPEKIICARKESPLVLGIAEDSVYVASDINKSASSANLSQFLQGEVSPIIDIFFPFLI